MKSDDISVYIHIPFCVRKCLYCDFTSFPDSLERMGAYKDALKAELSSRQDVFSGRKLASVYFGGGTPSLMDPGIIKDLIDTLRAFIPFSDDIEISMEMNPGTIDREKARGFFDAGINRVSMGMQSAVDSELKALGRIHDNDDLLRSYDLVKNAGFDNISLDIMYGIPGQSLKTLAMSLDQAISLGPTHISAYSLIIEDGTPFGKMREEELRLPAEDLAYDMHRFVVERLGSVGYERYEISNYAKAGYPCRHNIRYWDRDDYLGLGVSAASLVGGRRWTNTSSLDDYIKNPENSAVSVQELSTEEMMEEYMFLGLRKINGVSVSGFYSSFGKEFSEVYGKISEDHMEKGLSYRDGDRYMLTKKGLDVSNIVLADYLLCKV